MQNRNRVLVLLITVLGAFVLRALPHPANVTPIAATALFSGAYLGRGFLGLAVPVLAMLFSDLLLELTLGMGFHVHMFAVYGCLMVTVVLGSFLLRASELSIWRVGGTTLLSSVLFFLVTNASVWFFTSYYPKDLTGLSACYVAALPFFERTIAGDLFFSTLLFGGFALAQKTFPSLRLVTSELPS